MAHVIAVVAATEATAHSGVPELVRVPVLAFVVAAVMGVVSGWPRRRGRRQAERAALLTRLATDLRLLIAAREGETARPSGLDRADEG